MVYARLKLAFEGQSHDLGLIEIFIDRPKPIFLQRLLYAVSIEDIRKGKSQLTPVVHIMYIPK